MDSSSLSRSLLGTCRKLTKTVPFQAVLCFFALYTTLISFSIPILILLLYRQVLSLVFKVFYQGKYQLTQGVGALFAATDAFACVQNITYFIYIDGRCDIEKLRKRISKNILAKDKNGNRPYGILLKTPVEKFGFVCQEERTETIDFKNHVRLLNDSNKVWTEHEFLDAVAKLTDQLWDDTKPKWELLVVPKVIREGSEEISSGIALRFHHVYVDGISLAQFVRNCVVDQPAPKLTVDPVNIILPSVSFYQKIVLGLQMFFMGPYNSLRLLGNDYDPVFTENPLTGGKLIGRTKMKIPLEMMRRIRKYHDCTTQAVLHSAFIGSFHKMAKKKGISIPDEIIGTVMFANFPYPNEYPTNNQNFGFEPISTINIANPLARLADVNKSMMDLSSRTYGHKISLILLNLTGILPAALIRASAESFKMAYYVSNVPGIQETATIDGKDVVLMYGTGPFFNHMRYISGVAFYGGSFHITLNLEASKIMSSREELEEWIWEYENEIRYLDMRATAA